MNRIKKSFYKYVTFNIISTLGVSIYILIDTYFISKGMGANGLAALNLCLPVFNFINGFGLMLGMGGGSRFSMLYCRTERRETDKIFTNSFFAAVLISAVFEIIGIFFSKRFTLFLGADSSIFEMSHGYLRTILKFSPFFILNNLLVCFMRNDCAPRLATVGVLGGSLANIILDYIFIFRLGLGMEGAALATCLSPIISMIIMSYHFLTGWNAFRLTNERPSLNITKRIASLGFYSFLTEISGGIVIMVFNSVFYKMMGNTGIAAYGITANLAIVFTAIFTGLACGVQPLMCREHGGKDENAGKYLLRLSFGSVFFLSAVSYAAVFIGAPYIVSIFNSGNNAELSAAAEKGLRMYFTFLPFMGINSVLSVYFASLEKPLPSQFISLLRGSILVIPLAFLFCVLHRTNGVWLTIPAAELITAAISGFMLYFISKPNEEFFYTYHHVDHNAKKAS